VLKKNSDVLGQNGD